MMPDSATLIIVVLLLTGALLGTTAVLFRLQDRMHQRVIDLKDQQRKDTEDYLQTSRNLLKDATERLLHVATLYADLMGKEPPKIVAPVVPEHSSPTTPFWELVAELATQRAVITAVDLTIGYPPRTEEDRGGS